MEFNPNNTEERTQDIYEQLPHYPKPPMVPLPDWATMVSLQGMGIKPSGLSRAIGKTLMALTGFKRFYNQLPEHLEDWLRKTNMRGAGLFALINSASMALSDDPRDLTPAQRAATLVYGTYRFYDDLMSGKLEPDKYKDQVLEMGQYPNLFSTCLTIEGKTARLFKSKRTDQITVIIRGRYFLLNVGHPGKDTTVADLALAIQKLIDFVQSEQKEPNTLSPGLLTGIAHPVQLRMFGKLLQNPENRDSFYKIRHSFVTVCLDLDDTPQTFAEAAKITQSQNFYNRWYHASLQIVVFGNARAATFLNFNTYIDGNPMMRGSAEIQRRAAEAPIDEKGHEEKIAPAQELKWHIAPAFIERAKQVAETVLDDQQATFELTGIGKEFYAQRQLNPVPAFMTVIDAAVKELIGRHANIAQYLSMSKYCCMNLANANATTPEVKAFVDYVAQDTFDRQTARDLLQKAIASQAEAYRNARRYLPPSKIVSMFVSSRKGLSKLWVTSVLALAMIFLKVLGLYEGEEMEVIASHPKIEPEIPVVGRPGIRLPYVRYFGFHYQIFDDKTVLTFMPSPKWQISNQKLAETIAKKVKILENLFDEKRP